MAILDTYSNRLKDEQCQNNDVYDYDKIPEELIVQIIWAAKELIGECNIWDNTLFSYNLFHKLHDILLPEWGLDHLPSNHPVNSKVYFTDLPNSFTSYFKKSSTPYLHILDFIEGLFITQEFVADHYPEKIEKFNQKLIDLSDELNKRFRMVGVGYQIENQKVIQIDHQHIHKEIVKPALAIINNPVFKTVNKDYRAAYEHYRNQHVKDCITACNRAFEAMLKAICTEYQWSYDSKARASDLIKIVRKEGLFQDNMDKTFDSFIATLKTGVPELRNQLGGHGSDPQTESPPLYMASYLLHLTATNIIFLYEAFKAYKPDRE